MSSCRRPSTIAIGAAKGNGGAGAVARKIWRRFHAARHSIAGPAPARADWSGVAAAVHTTCIWRAHREGRRLPVGTARNAALRRSSGSEVEAIADPDADPRVRSEPGLRVDKPRDVVRAAAHEIDPGGGPERGEVVGPFDGRRLVTLKRLRGQVARADVGVDTEPRDVPSEPWRDPQAPYVELERRGDVGEDPPIVELLCEVPVRTPRAGAP